MKVKYIMLDNCKPVIFGEELAHVDVARSLTQEGEVTSAGFVHVYTTKDNLLAVQAYGESISLGIKSDEKNDSRVLKRLFSSY